MPSFYVRCRSTHIQIFYLLECRTCATSLLIHLDNLDPQALRFLTRMAHKTVSRCNDIPLSVYIVQLELEASEQCCDAEVYLAICKTVIIS